MDHRTNVKEIDRAGSSFADRIRKRHVLQWRERDRFRRDQIESRRKNPQHTVQAKEKKTAVLSSSDSDYQIWERLRELNANHGTVRLDATQLSLVTRYLTPTFSAAVHKLVTEFLANFTKNLEGAALVAHASVTVPLLDHLLQTGNAHLFHTFANVLSHHLLSGPERIALLSKVVDRLCHPGSPAETLHLLLFLLDCSLQTIDNDGSNNVSLMQKIVLPVCAKTLTARSIPGLVRKTVELLNNGLYLCEPHDLATSILEDIPRIPQTLLELLHERGEKDTIAPLLRCLGFLTQSPKAGLLHTRYHALPLLLPFLSTEPPNPHKVTALLIFGNLLTDDEILAYTWRNASFTAKFWREILQALNDSTTSTMEMKENAAFVVSTALSPDFKEDVKQMLDAKVPLIPILLHGLEYSHLSATLTTDVLTCLQELCNMGFRDRIYATVADHETTLSQLTCHENPAVSDAASKLLATIEGELDPEEEDEETEEEP